MLSKRHNGRITPDHEAYSKTVFDRFGYSVLEIGGYCVDNVGTVLASQVHLNNQILKDVRILRMKRIGLLATLVASSLALTACVSGDGSNDDDDSSGEEITIASVEGWSDTVSVSLLWQEVLKQEGYDAKIEYADISVAFLGVAEGDYDLYTNAWLPQNHGAYYKKYKDQMENLGAWNSDGVNTIAVNEDAPIDTLDELAEHADEFDNQIVGIEPGSGHMQWTEDKVIPKYGLDDMELVESSTAAMLAELKAKTDANKNVAVTLWQPHWAYDQFPIKTLEDTKNAYGDPQDIVTLAHKGFSKDHPEAAEWLKNFDMDLDTYNSLQAALFTDDDPDKYHERLVAWMKDNQEWVDSITE
jgi:glycine betaine/proline transport system substrate-binding protein